MNAEELARKLGEEFSLMVAEAEAVGGAHPSVAPWSFEKRLLPYAQAFLAMREALVRIKADGDYSGFEEALAQADALLDPKGGERG